MVFRRALRVIGQLGFVRLRKPPPDLQLAL